MRSRAIALAGALILAPLDANAADLVVWWEEGLYPSENEAVAEVISAFQQDSGKQVELVFHSYDDLPAKVLEALAAGQPPGFVFGLDIDRYYGQWAYEGRLAELTDALGSLVSLFFPDSLERATLFNGKTGQRALYALPMGRTTIHLPVWKSLLEQASLTLDDIPKEWEDFWSFWCDRVQPAVRRATGRDDVWGVGLSMSVGAADTLVVFKQFLRAYEAHYVARDGRLVIEDPEVRRRLIKAMDSYTALYRKDCTPPEAVDWDGSGNNKAFVAQRVVMTPNPTLFVQSALKRSRPEDYYRNTATIEWPNGASGQPLAIFTGFFEAAVFRGSGQIETAKEFVRFLVDKGWLVHWLDFAGDRMLPPMPQLLEQPFWLDPSDPHRMALAIQFLTRPRDYHYAAVSGEWRHRGVDAENVWSNAVHRVVTKGISPAQAVDEAIARTKQILAE
jgi:multiple sugar transport system substrate-binding protein